MSSQVELPVGQKIYYSGDMANSPGWFTVTDIRRSQFGVSYDLTEIKGERVFLGTRNIGHVYAGHCDPRMVTSQAYDAFYARLQSVAANIQL